LSTLECETCSCGSFPDNIKYQTSVKTKQATVQQSNLPELANINCVEPLSSISTEIACCGNTNDEETIQFLDDKNNGNSTDSNAELLEQMVHYNSNYDIESDDDSTNNDVISTVSSKMLYSNSHMTVDMYCYIKFC